MSDAAYGVRSSGENGRYSTALPADVAAAASWDLDAAYEYGALIGRELRAQGYNMTLGGGINLTREPRNGRTFEYLGEDPVLAGKMVGSVMKGLQAQHVLGDIKHYALNDQESGRNAVNITIDKRAARESDLLAFEIGLQESDVAAVMCSYNRVDGDYACENKYLLTDLLKKDWNFKGFVLSDWGGTHSAEKASAAGLDHEQPGEIFYGATMKKAVESGKVPTTELDDHVQRILRSMFATGVVDDPPQRGVVDIMGGLEVAQKIAESEHRAAQERTRAASARRHENPQHRRYRRPRGRRHDFGRRLGTGRPSGRQRHHAPGQRQHLLAGTRLVPNFAPEDDSGQSSREPKFSLTRVPIRPQPPLWRRTSDVAIVFVHEWESEGMDLDSLSLPDHQDDLIAKVAAANPHTVVIIESGTAVTMPWADQVSGIVEAWYAGSRGAEAVANILFGDVNPSAKLPMTFPRSVADLPHPNVVHPPKATTDADQQGWKRIAAGLPSFDVTYDEGVKVGYKWYDAEGKPVLFPFGYGLSYTTYSYSNLKVSPGKNPHVALHRDQHGQSRGSRSRGGLRLAAGRSCRNRRSAWSDFSKIKLNAGESKEVTVEVDAKYLSIFNVEQNGWQLLPGDYGFMVGGSSQSLPLKESVKLQ